MSRLPHTISNQSLTFFVKGKPYSLTKGHEHYAAAKNLLQSPGAHPVQQLIDMVDQRQALIRDSHGALQIIGSELVYKGQALKGVWVDKIKQFRAAGEPFAPLFNALGSLVLNPTAAAIERLPVFLEKSNLGFLEDGRFIAYKAVKEDYFDIHTGCTFRNMIGDTPFMPRTQVDADPNSCCSTGLHVGTPDYVKDFGLGNRGRRVMLIAVWPHDVVSVPHSYEGTKMRICAYEVIDELDDAYAGAILGRPVITPRSHLPEVPDAAEAPAAVFPTDYQGVQAGDVIMFTDFGADIWARVVDIDNDLPVVLDIEGNRREVTEAEFQEVVALDEVTAAMLVYAGCKVEIEGNEALRDGTYHVFGLDEDGEDVQSDDLGSTFLVYLSGNGGATAPVMNQEIKRVLDGNDLQLFPLPPIGLSLHLELAQESDDEALEDEVEDEDEPYQPLPGDLIEATGEGWPPRGVYPVLVANDVGATVQTEHDGVQVILASRYGAITPRPWMRAKINGTVNLRATGEAFAPFRNGGTGIEVADLKLDGDNPQIQVRTRAGNLWVAATRVID